MSWLGKDLRADKRIIHTPLPLRILLIYVLGPLIGLLFSHYISSAATNPSLAPDKKIPPNAFESPIIIAPPTDYSTLELQKKEKLAAIAILNEEQAETLSIESIQGDDIPFINESTEATLDSYQQKGSEILLTATEWVDSFFDDPRYLAEENRTRLKVKLGLGYSKHYELETYSALDLRLSLPNLENKTNVFLSLNDDSDFDSDSAPIGGADDRRTDNEGSLTAGIQHFLVMGEKYNLSTEVGVSLDYVYGGVRYRHLHPLFNDEWSGRLTNRLRYYTDDGWENKTSYDIERFLGERFFTRSTLTAVFAESEEGVPFSVVGRLYQVLDIDSALSYNVGAYFDTEPEAEVSDIQFILRYRQRFYRDWLVFEVAPSITFPAEYYHEFNPGLLTKFEFDFGYLNDHEAFESVFKF